MDAKCQLWKADGSGEQPITDKLANSMIMHHAPHSIERTTILHGNGAGDILYEITNHAHALYDMQMQGMEDASEYGQYIVTSHNDIGTSPVSTDGLVRYDQESVICNPDDDAGILNEYWEQVSKIQKERAKKYRYQKRFQAAGDAVGEGF